MGVTSNPFPPSAPGGRPTQPNTGVFSQAVTSSNWTSNADFAFPSASEEQSPGIERGYLVPRHERSPDCVELGILLATLRPDIFREDYMNELCILQDYVPPFLNQVAFNIIEEELGRSLEAIFFSARTMAAASLGQVYQTTLRETREDVAIKVQRPDIEPV